MIDIRLIRTNPELVKENIKKKFQDEKLDFGGRGNRIGRTAAHGGNRSGYAAQSAQCVQQADWRVDGTGQKRGSGRSKTDGCQHWSETGGAAGKRNPSAE